MSHGIVFAVSLLILTMSCKGDASCKAGEPMTVAATVAGENYCGAVENVIVNASGGTISVASSNDNSTSVNFGFGDTGDTFTIGPNVPLSFQVDTSAGTWTAAEMVGSGSLTVGLRTPSSASGTFTFVGQPLTGSTGTKIVENGSFNVTF